MGFFTNFRLTSHQVPTRSVLVLRHPHASLDRFTVATCDTNSTDFTTVRVASIHFLEVIAMSPIKPPSSAQIAILQLRAEAPLVLLYSDIWRSDVTMSIRDRKWLQEETDTSIMLNSRRCMSHRSRVNEVWSGCQEGWLWALTYFT